MRMLAAYLIGIGSALAVGFMTVAYIQSLFAAGAAAFNLH